MPQSETRLEGPLLVGGNEIGASCYTKVPAAIAIHLEIEALHDPVLNPNKIAPTFSAETLRPQRRKNNFGDRFCEFVCHTLILASAAHVRNWVVRCLSGMAQSKV